MIDPLICGAKFPRSDRVYLNQSAELEISAKGSSLSFVHSTRSSNHTSSTMSDTTQSSATTSFLQYFTSEAIGGYVNPLLESRYDEQTGLSMFSTSPIPAEERLITCPASWVITPEICRRTIRDLKGKGKEVQEDGMEGWKETMLICGYICLHWIHHDLGE